MSEYHVIHRKPDGSVSHLVPVDAEPIIEDGEIVGYRLQHNAVLEGGPGDGLLMDLRTATLVWDSPWSDPEPGEYQRTDRTDAYGRSVYDWHPEPFDIP